MPLRKRSSRARSPRTEAERAERNDEEKGARKRDRKRAAKAEEKPAVKARRPRQTRRRRRRPAVSARSASRAARGVVYEIGAILVEVVRIPLRAWLRVAEAAGAVVLGAWRLVWPLLAGAARLAKRLGVWASRTVTPARASFGVALFAAGALAASQFADYRAIEIGARDYQGVTSVAPPPSVGAATPQDPHGLWLIAIAAVAIGLLLFAAATKRWRYLRLLVPLGAAAVLIAIVVDRPEGLETGPAGIAYEGARATLLSGFGAEIAAGAVLAFSGLLLSLYAPAGPAGEARRRARSRRGRAKAKPKPAPAARTRRPRPGPPRKASG